MLKEERIYQIAITQIPYVGMQVAKKLIAYCGGVKQVFEARKSELMKIPGIGPKLTKSILAQNKDELLERAKREIEFIEKNNIQPVFYTEKAFPKRLKYCPDSPVMIYTKGEMNLGAEKVLAIVGTRNATTYGKEMCEAIVEELAGLDVLIVSGLAYGIDVTAHKAALKHNLPTVGVLGHGLDKIYPQMHRHVANDMQANGGLVSEFLSETKPDRENFPKRNRIIAGLADAVLVVEAGAKGGALITADIAHSYSRDVFAVPGRTTDKYSQGCNWLISRNKGALVNSATDLKYQMNWETDEKKSKRSVVQKKMFVEFSEDEQRLAKVLQENGPQGIDELSLKSKMTQSQVATLLLNLELNGVVSVLPGKVYKLS